MILLIEEYEKMKEEAIFQLSQIYPDIAIRNLIQVIWVGDVPFFYIEYPY